MSSEDASTCCTVGLGYVGLSLAYMLAESGYETTGYDIDGEKIRELQAGRDPIEELPADALPHERLEFTDAREGITGSDFVFVALPSPLDGTTPDISMLEAVSETVGASLDDDAVVVYESTLYPGAVREALKPAIERGIDDGSDISVSVGYSPERIAAGEPQSHVSDAVKIVSGEDERTRVRLAALYDDISDIHLAESIETAEAAKCLENVQRDVNIALVNEFTMGARQLDIDLDPYAVLEAAGTKWNFHDEYVPGIVGGHCIPVDPHYLRHRFERDGFEPKVLSDAREVNERMRSHVAAVTAEALLPAEDTDSATGQLSLRGDGGREGGLRLLILGLSYKTNLQDTRNSPAHGVSDTLRDQGIEVVGYDPHVDRATARTEFDFEIQSEVDFDGFDGTLVLTPHDRVLSLDLNRAAQQMRQNPVLVDVGNAFDPDRVTAAGFRYRRP